MEMKYRVPITIEEEKKLILNIKDDLLYSKKRLYSLNIEEVADYIVHSILEHDMLTRKRKEYIIDSDGSLKKNDK